MWKVKWVTNEICVSSVGGSGCVAKKAPEQRAHYWALGHKAALSSRAPIVDFFNGIKTPITSPCRLIGAIYMKISLVRSQFISWNILIMPGIFLHIINSDILSHFIYGPSPGALFIPANFAQLRQELEYR